jgi:hypothetical protein
VRAQQDLPACAETIFGRPEDRRGRWEASARQADRRPSGDGLAMGDDLATTVVITGGISILEQDMQRRHRQTVNRCHSTVKGSMHE